MDTKVELPLQIRQTEFAARFNLTLEEYLLIVRSCTTAEAVTVLELMKSKDPKSAYRKRLQETIRRWLHRGLVGKPLLPAQFKELYPKYRIDWELPR